jgi:hypothetical protein
MGKRPAAVEVSEVSSLATIQRAGFGAGCRRSATPARRRGTPGRRRATPPPSRRPFVQTVEPLPWIVVLVAVLVVILGAHDRIARVIGTAAPATQTPVAVAAPAANVISYQPAAAISAGSALPAITVPLPNRAPRDPFRALVSPTGTRVLAVSLRAGKSGTAHAHHPQSAPTSPVAPVQTGPSSSQPKQAGCAASHVVRPGESLWSIAAKHVKQPGQGVVDRAWQRIYAANRAAVGDNPSLLRIGVHLCLPT